MNDQLREHEAELERDMTLLADLPVIRPVPATLVRVKAAVKRAARLGRAERAVWRWARYGGGFAAAAALLLVFVQTHPMPATRTGGDGPVDTAIIDRWVEAASQSDEGWSLLLSELDADLRTDVEGDEDWQESFNIGARTGA